MAEGKAAVKTVAVLGIGRVGLPLCLILAEAGFRVFGIDVRQDYVEKIKRGEMPFLEEKAQPLLDKHVNKQFFPTTDSSRVKESDYIILTLGTPVDEHLNPDYGQINSVMEDIKDKLKEGQTLVLRSTVAPGTTEFLKDYVERETEFRVGENLFLAFCPERIAEGKAIEETKEIPQIIGALDEKSKKKAKELFDRISRESISTDAMSAELAKIFTNMYRYINFSIANEFMILAEEHGRDIYEIIELVNKDYKRGGLKQPGYAAGPCLYKDGFFLVNAMPFNELISVAWKINETTPLYLLKKIKEKMVLKDKKAVILGMAFKSEIDDTRQSLAFKIRKALLREHASVVCHDPFVEEFNSDLNEAVKGADLVIIAMNHAIYKKKGLEELKKAVGKQFLVCDIWNVFGKNKIIYAP